MKTQATTKSIVSALERDNSVWIDGFYDLEDNFSLVILTFGSDGLVFRLYKEL